MTIRALVTGAGGFVGRNLIEALQASGREVTAMVHSEKSKPALAEEECEVFAADIRQPDDYRTAVQRADEVYHLASMLAPTHERPALEVNAEGTRRLAECIGDCESPAKLVYVSSLAAAGPSIGDRPRRECDPPAPVSIYGRSKLAAEQQLIQLADRMPISIVRPPGVFGPRDHNLISLMAMIRRGINLIGISREYRYNFVHVTDLVDAMILMADRGERVSCVDSNDCSGIYFIADALPATFVELGNWISDAMGREKYPWHVTSPTPICAGVAFCSDCYSRLTGQRVYLNIDKMREARAGSWVCDTSKASEELGFNAAQPLDQRIAETYQWYVENGWL